MFIRILKKVFLYLKRISGYVRSFISFCIYRPDQNRSKDEEKIIFLDISHNYFTRYLYLFLKFFSLEGYTVYLPKSLRLFHHLKTDYYASFLLREKLIKFGVPSRRKRRLTINNSQISPDYFSDFKKHSASNESFYVPMTQHPLMYHLGYWNTPVKNTGRKKSIFMAGNFDPVAYSKIEEDGLFRLLSRVAVYEYLYKQNLLLVTETWDGLQNFIKSPDDGRIILVNRLIFDIPMSQLRSLLGEFDFYFALPGVIMPFSHNIIEAMSAGSIPFLQEEYAAMFKPALKPGINAITFKDAGDLVTQLNFLLTLCPERIAELRKQVYTYYNNHLTPKAVIDKIIKAPGDKIYLQAEHFSVELLKNRLKIGAKLHLKTRPHALP